MAAKNKVKAFQNALFSEDMMENVMDWVRENYTPDEVFEEEDLAEWAQEQDINEIVADEDLVNWAAENGYISEEDEEAMGEWASDHGYVNINEDDELVQWAEDNGYILEENCDCDD